MGLASAGGFLPPVIAEIIAKTDQFSAEMKKVRGEIDATAAKGGTSFAKLGAAGKVAFAAIGVAAVFVGVESIKMADQFEGAHTRLTTAIKNSGSSFDVWKSQIDAADKKMEHLGFTNTQTQDALSTLTNATHNTGKALSDLSLAADVARGRHIDLASAVGILAKVETGHVALLGRLGINVKDVTGKTISQEEAIKRLSALYGGNASAYAQTFSGKMQVLKATVTDLGTQLGLALIPKVEAVASAFAGTVRFLNENHAAAAALAVVVGGPLVVAMGAFVALKVQAAAAGIAKAFAMMTVTAEEGTVALSTFGVASIAMAGAAVAAVGLAVAYESLTAHSRGVKTVTDEITAAMQNEGKSATQAAAEILAKWIAAHADEAGVLKAAGVSVTEYFQAIQGGKGALEDVTAKLDEYEAKASGVAQVTAKGKGAYQQLASGAAEAAAKVDKLKNQIGLQAQGLDRAKTSTSLLASTTKDLAAVTTDAAAAVAKEDASVTNLTTHVLDLNDAHRTLGADIRAVTTSLLDVHDKQVAYTQAVKAHGKASEEAIRAALDLQAAQDGVGAATDTAKRAIIDLAVKETGAKDATAAASTKTAAYRADLQRVASQLAPNSPLRVWLDEYIAKLRTVPSSIDTYVNIHADTNAATPRRRHASGGLLGSGPWSVAENMPELVDPSGYVHSGAETARMLGRSGGSSGGGGGGSKVINVNIDARGSLADPNALGRTVYAALYKLGLDIGGLKLKISA